MLPFMTKEDGLKLREARRARVRMIRSRVIGGSVALFMVVWSLIAVVLVTGHDPALAKKATTTSALTTTASSGSAGTGSSGTTVTTGASGSTSSTSATNSAGSGSSTGFSNSTGSSSGVSPVTSSQS